MRTEGLRRAAIALLVIGALAACKRDKPTEPPPDDEPVEQTSVR